MYRTLLVIGAAFDLLIALFLVIVFGWVLDSWHDRDPWAGPIVTTVWGLAFLLSAGAPILAYWFNRRHASPGRVVLAMWLPAVLLVAISAVSFAVFPP
jgi:biotin transporter BioY